MANGLIDVSAKLAEAKQENQRISLEQIQQQDEARELRAQLEQARVNREEEISQIQDDHALHCTEVKKEAEDEVMLNYMTKITNKDKEFSDLEKDFDDQMTQLNSNLAQAKAEIKALSIDKESLSTEVKNLRDTIIKRDGFIA